MPGVSVIIVQKHKVIADKMCQQFNTIMPIGKWINIEAKRNVSILIPNPQVKFLKMSEYWLRVYLSNQYSDIPADG